MSTALLNSKLLDRELPAHFSRAEMAELEEELKQTYNLREAPNLSIVYYLDKRRIIIVAHGTDREIARQTFELQPEIKTRRLHRRIVRSEDSRYLFL